MSRSCRFALVAVVGLVGLTPSTVIAQDPQKPQAPPAQKTDDPPSTGIYWRNRPSIQLGEHVRLDLRLKLAYDWRRFDPQIDELPDDWRFRRAGINGEIGEDIEFQIERDLNRFGRWRDVYINWGKYRQLEVTAGRFKVPFGHEELIGIADVDFAFRTLVSTTIPPARDRGVMVHGRFLQRGFTYQVGVFDDDGDNGRLQEEQFSVTGEIGGVGPSLAARVTATPLRPLAETFETLRVGVAYGTVEMPEGLNSLRGETVYGTEDFFEPVYIKGRRARMGAEFNYTPGPVGLTAEWMRAREQRRNQGLGDVDLSDVLTTGWYTSATWLVTGEDKENFNNPRRPLFDGGIGAIELGVRYEKLQFESEEKVGPAFRNPRAAHILGNSDKVLTFGISWFVNRWVRITGNIMREEFEDATRTPLPGVTEFRSGVARLQLVF
jgi:phosphate-selective porin OprO and OprP